jgi:hypothetical protein
VLGINVSMLLLAGCLTLLAQHALGRTSWPDPPWRRSLISLIGVTHPV